MDTFMVSVDLGDVEIERLSLARAKNILAEVGFGSLVLSFDELPQRASEIWARVGAGSLEINLPTEEHTNHRAHEGYFNTVSSK